MALVAYRHLLRSTRLAFAGDAPLLSAARGEARNAFRKNMNLEIGGAEFASAVKHAEEVAKILTENVVQGKKVEGDSDKYKLRIHDQTERGDNDSIKMPNGQTVVIDGKTCADQ